MALTKTQIISYALSKMGHKTVTTLNNPDDIVISAELAFDMLLPSVLASGNWRFATMISQLTKSVEIPPDPYKSIYLLPSGWLKTRRVYPLNYAWDIFENRKIYTLYNSEQPFSMQFVFSPDVSRLPMYFVNYFVYEIAASLALSNAQKPEYFGALEQKRVTTQAMAMAIDAQNRPTEEFTDFPVLTSRDSGGQTFL